MTIRRKDNTEKMTLDLTGPDGNAFVVLGTCKGIAKQLGVDWAPIAKDAMSGDYEHLLAVMDEHFGDVIDFLR